ncbi:MFS transporter [Amorphus orientalis]|uniref:MFS family permease n=1 Tax=Amorphus orientalis TaxID=649198 RepID=A0AAE4AUU9_9HYPH|nr:MFS transporter [Amorphus orientalis]MDQ0317547.1 MFS family permease [Amorphus orientalis]
MHASGSRASDRVAGLVGLVLSIAVGAVFALVLLASLRSEEARLYEASRMVATSIAQSISDVVQRAVQVGIPIKDLTGVDPYLSGIIDANEEVDAVAISDANGEILFRAGKPAEETEADAVSVPVAVGNRTVGRILVTPKFVAVATVRHDIAALALASSILAGLLGGLWFRLHRLEEIDLPSARLVVACRAAARGNFADYSSPPENSPLRRLGTRIARLTAPVRRKARDAYALADEILAIDVTGAFTSRVQDALAPLSAYRFDHLTQPYRRAGWGGWIVLPMLVAAEATAPLVGNFMADRIGPEPIAQLYVGGGFIAEALGRLLAIPVVLLIAARLPRAGMVAGLLLAAVGIGSTYWNHDPYQFAVARFAAGFGIWLAAWSALTREGTARRLPWRAALLLLCAWGIGPVLGALIAEFFGRRMAFLITGIATAILALVCLTQPWRGTSRASLSWRGPPLPALLALVAVMAVTVAWLQIHVALFMPIRYSLLALHFALAGAAMSVPWWTGLRLQLPVSASIALAAVVAYLLAPVPVWPISVAVGFGFGAVIAGLGAQGFRMASATAMIAGFMLAGIASVVGFILNLEPLSIVCVLAAALVLTAAATSARTGARRTQPSTQSG